MKDLFMKLKKLALFFIITSLFSLSPAHGISELYSAALELPLWIKSRQDGLVPPRNLPFESTERLYLFYDDRLVLPIDTARAMNDEGITITITLSNPEGMHSLESTPLMIEDWRGQQQACFTIPRGRYTGFSINLINSATNEIIQTLLYQQPILSRGSGN